MTSIFVKKEIQFFRLTLDRSYRNHFLYVM